MLLSSCILIINWYANRWWWPNFPSPTDRQSLLRWSSSLHNKQNINHKHTEEKLFSCVSNRVTGNALDFLQHASKWIMSPGFAISYLGDETGSYLNGEGWILLDTIGYHWITRSSSALPHQNYWLSLFNRESIAYILSVIFYLLYSLPAILSNCDTLRTAEATQLHHSITPCYSQKERPTVRNKFAALFKSVSVCVCTRHRKRSRWQAEGWWKRSVGSLSMFWV